MKTLIASLTHILAAVILISLPAIGQRPQSATIQGELLKSDGHPLAYTEIELVPTTSNKIINDSRLIGVSSLNGRFSFVDVPAGKYTLSINFDDKPTYLSPYATYFFPGTTKRSEAQVLEISALTKLRGVVFKLPPELVKKKIVGRVVWTDGVPVKGAIIGCRDLEFDVIIPFGSTRTDAKGAFSVEGFAGRSYQLGAIVFEREILKPFDDPGPVIAAGETDVFKLESATPTITLKVALSRDTQKIYDKYVGQMIYHNYHRDDESF